MTGSGGPRSFARDAGGEAGTFSEKARKRQGGAQPTAGGTGLADRLREVVASWLPRMSLQHVVLGAVLFITALGLATSILLGHALGVRNLHERIDGDIAQEVQELRSLADSPDPNTGEPFDSVRSLLHTALERNVPSRSEEFLAVVDLKVPFVSAAPRPMRLETNEELERFLTHVDVNAGPVYGTLTEGGVEIRFAAVPVMAENDPEHGIFVAAVDTAREKAELTTRLHAMLSAALVTLLLVSVVGVLVLRAVLRPLAELTAFAGRVNDHHLDERASSRSTREVVTLSRTVNGMLDRLNGSLKAQRALLDDVGHELRTPLTVIRGHLEMVDAHDPSDVLDTRELLIDEVDRMSRLVDELVLLARSERPDFLQTEPVDIDDVVSGVLERGKSLADRQFRIDEVAGAVLEVDRQRLTQALLQLLSNAVRHTEPGDQIALGARTSPAEPMAEIWVRDTGSGIEPADHQRVFERFERAADAESEGGSSGLGLSIVSAIAKAHGGRVDLISAPGRGSTFTLLIPRTPADRRPSLE